MRNRRQDGIEVYCHQKIMSEQELAVNLTAMSNNEDCHEYNLIFYPVNDAIMPMRIRQRLLDPRNFLTTPEGRGSSDKTAKAFDTLWRTSAGSLRYCRWAVGAMRTSYPILWLHKELV